tara:strand:+ start:2838 stop:3299 length:462 start_codon:yes stop_codon:yes gene_type:complete
MKGKIYKITNGELNYYGSTTKKYLSSRLSQHKYDVKKRPSLSVNKILCYDNYSIELMEELEIENFKELHKRERYYIENFDCVNHFIPGQTREEVQRRYRNNNKDKIKTYYNEVRKEKRKTDFKFCNCCNITILKNSFSTHTKTKKHKKNISLL